MFDDSSDNFIDLTDLSEQPEPSDNFDELFGEQPEPSDNLDELFGDENDAPVASIEFCGVKPSSGGLVVVDQWETLSGWAL